MAVFPVKLYKISRVVFVIIIIIQGFVLSKYVVDHENCKHEYLGLAAMFIVVSLLAWVVAVCTDKLKNSLGIVWLSYMVALVIMIGWIFGEIVIDNKKLTEEILTSNSCNNSAENATNSDHSDSFFDSKFLKITLCFTPGEMLLLLTSVTDESGTLELLYLTTVMDLFDGVEMLEVLQEDVCNKIPEELKYAILVAASLFFLLSSFEVHKVKFKDNGESKERKKTAKSNILFQIILNLLFLIIRLVLWFGYDFDSAVFIAKNVIGFVIALVPVLESQTCGIISY
jgi:hypothetical protein